MSFDQHIPYPISRANYEEAFLLYVDGELSREEAAAVEAFAILHPDLKDELDLLCGMKLPADAVPFENKSELLADSMKLNAVDESLLLYIDGELPHGERESVEAQLRHDAAFALQHELLLKTKLDASEQITYPYKDELYRRTHKRIVPAWLRMAAAVVLMAGAGTVAWMGMDGSKHTEPGVAVAFPQKDTEPPTVVEAAQPKKPIVESKPVAVAEAHPVATHRKPANEKQALPKKENRTFSNTHAAAHPVAHTGLPVAETARTNNLATDTTGKPQQPSLNIPDVTLKTPPAYVPPDAVVQTTVPVYTADVENSNQSGGGVKGLLRKATRFVERRTGIKAVNDDGELLVGAVALKL